MMIFCANVFLFAQKSPIYLERCNRLEFDQERLPDCQVLKDDVVFTHEGAILYCDSAYFFDKTNSVDAFGHIRMEQGDTLFVFGDILHYDGNTKMARLKGNVRMINRETTLETDSMDYDRNIDVGYYFTGGTIYDEKSKLTSIYGEYSPQTKISKFQNDVRLLNEKTVLGSNDLVYNTISKIAFVKGPTVIVHEEETTLYTEEGWYNTKTQQSQGYKSNKIDRLDGKHALADTLFYDKMKGEITAFRNVVMWDTIQKLMLRSHYAYARQADEYMIAYDHAVVHDFSSPKDTLYLYADTLRSVQDQQDTTINRAWAIGNVRFFRSDLQGKCDSITFSTKDSIVNLYEAPVLWADSMQLSGEFMQIYTENKKPKMLHVQSWAAAAMREDSIRFSQLSGKSLKGYIRDNQLYKILVEGNAETIYYPKEEDGSLVGVNRAESSALTVYVKNKDLEKIVMTPNSSGVLYPEDQFPENLKYLKNYSWQEDVRPKDKLDIFRRNPKIEKVEDDSKKRKNDVEKNNLLIL